MKSSPLVLLIWDGFGCGPLHGHNAIYRARMAHFLSLKDRYPYTRLQAAGKAVGLAPGVVGNSEVGHLTIGAGAITPAMQQHITQEITDGRFAQHAVFAVLAKQVVHLVGLVSDGGVHSSLAHLRACVAALQQQGAHKILLHAILDGRDTPPQSAAKYLKIVTDELPVQLASVQGRFYAMDRDSNHDRTACSVALLHGKAECAASWQEVLAQSYAQGLHDEYILPTTLPSFESAQQDDAFFFFNTRADRMRQMVAAVLRDFPRCYTLVEYDAALTKKGIVGLYQKPLPSTTLLAQLTLQQPQWPIGVVAETEKYAHVTYFFDGGCEQQRANVSYQLIDSRKEMSHAQQPAMRAAAITDRICSWADEKRLIIANYANADMVGHSGDLAATTEACRVLDAQLGRLYEEIVVRRGGTIVLTSDHGNAEQMMANGQPCTSHTANDVPFLLLQKGMEGAVINTYSAGLSNVAPTLLQLLGCRVPREMVEGLVVTRRPDLFKMQLSP
ncbi:MAG: 2,3-bisphosphoglycerate-independent phosphoglycerate mutase [Candidatus Dependentiae bacterium]